VEYAKITSIELLDDEMETEVSVTEKGIESAHSEGLLHALPPASSPSFTHSFSFDGNESFSESVTLENMLDLSDSTDRSVSHHPAFPSALAHLQQESFEWSLFPSPESCPLGVGFIVALLTSPRPLMLPQSSNRIESCSPAVSTSSATSSTSEISKKKRRATLHPNILAPVPKKSKREEDMSSFW
jgi:hypothetical protein